MPLIETRGAASAQGFGEFAQPTSAAGSYIEDVFSTYLYTGNGTSQTITNGIDLNTDGGLVWIKARSAATDHAWCDTVRGATKDLASNLATAEQTEVTGLTAFGTTGFTIGALAKLNTSADTYASWTFRKEAKFFDIVTYTGNDVNRTVSHNLGAVPGFIAVKRTDSTGDWQVYHRELGNTKYFVLNTSGTPIVSSTRWNNTTPTDSVFSLGTDPTVNLLGGTYVAYLFAHNAGGFGNNGTDNVISCGAFTATETPQTINLGYEAQLVAAKWIDGSDPFYMFDVSRGMSVGYDEYLAIAQLNGEGTDDPAWYSATATGFIVTAEVPAGDYIYVAIRRGPMKAPTLGTQVFSPVAYTGNATARNVTGSNASVDLSILTVRDNGGAGGNKLWNDRLRGAYLTLYSNTDQANTDVSPDGVLGLDVQYGVRLGGGVVPQANGVGVSYVSEMFSRAPRFFDIVCYTGTGSATTFIHNLRVAPELMIVKRSDTTGDWWVYDVATGNTMYNVLNSTTIPLLSVTAWDNTTPTSSVFTVGTGTPVNASAGTYVAYLFATLAGISKVGSYTGTATTLQIDCGFTTGARFVLIKRTDSTGGWYYWDSARGIVAGNDPYLLINSNAVEVTSTDYVDTYSAGFELSSTAPAAINANGGTFIFLAIA